MLPIHQACWLKAGRGGNYELQYNIGHGSNSHEPQRGVNIRMVSYNTTLTQMHVLLLIHLLLLARRTGMMLQVLPFNACVSKKLLRSPGDFKGDGVIVNESMRVAIKIGPNRFTNIKAFCSTFSETDASQTVSLLVLG